MFTVLFVSLFVFFFFLSCDSTHVRKFPVTIKAPVGELLRGCPMAEKDFLTEQGEWFAARKDNA